MQKTLSEKNVFYRETGTLAELENQADYYDHYLTMRDEKTRKDRIINRIGGVIIKDVTVISRESRVMKWRCKQGLITVQ